MYALCETDKISFTIAVTFVNLEPVHPGSRRTRKLSVEVVPTTLAQRTRQTTD